MTAGVAPLRVGVMGAGAIGCYVGGRLAASGVPVVLVGRASLADEIARHGLLLSDYHGWRARVALGGGLAVATDAAALASADVVLVAVKSGDTRAAGSALAAVLAPGAVVVSLQNGVGNVEALREVLPARRVVPGMVPFNVVRQDGARFHHGTSGALALEDRPEVAALADALARSGLDVKRHADMVPVAWGKLVINLANAVNALAGVPIKVMLGERGYRRAIAACMREALAVLAAAGIRPAVPVAAPARLLPWLLERPDGLFRALARPMLAVDPEARSSMWDDLARGRRTEVDALNGEVVGLAARVGVAAPVNARVVALVRAAEAAGPASGVGLTAEALGARLGIGPAPR